jgi:hypothetical protein
MKRNWKTFLRAAKGLRVLLSKLKGRLHACRFVLNSARLSNREGLGAIFGTLMESSKRSHIRGCMKRDLDRRKEPWAILCKDYSK